MPDQQRHLLIVSDVEIDGAALAERVAGLGYDVGDVAPTLEAAAALVDAAAPDLIVLDLATGNAAIGARAVREFQPPRRPALLLMIAESDEGPLRSAGVTEPHAYVLRPCTDRELRVAIGFALCRHDESRRIDELENRFFTGSIDMLCHLGFAGHFKRLNPAWERTLGFTIDELRSKPFIEFVHPDDRERTLAQNAHVRTGGEARAFENRYLCKDGSFRWFRWNAAPDSIEQLIYSVARDVTAEKQAAEERETLLRELKAALAEVNALRRILPLCSYCRKVRDDDNFWHTVEAYLSQHSDTRYSHGICPDCMATVVEPQLAAL
jgi:PAS domain S-box-containing protein